MEEGVEQAVQLGQERGEGGFAAEGGAVVEGEDFGLLLHVEAAEMGNAGEVGQAVGAVFQVASAQGEQGAAEPNGEAVLVLPHVGQFVYQPGAFGLGAFGEVGAEVLGGEVDVAEGGYGGVARQPPGAAAQADAGVVQPVAEDAARELGFGGGEWAGLAGHGLVWFGWDYLKTGGLG